jgi:hypothetical protein
LTNKKSFRTSWEDAKNDLLETGWTDIKSGGGDNWNQEIAERLTKDCKKKVLLLGESSDYTNQGVYRFGLEAKNNRQAAILLSQTND